MAEVIEYRDILKEHRIKVKATNGNKTYASTEGYKNIKDARNTAINTSIAILAHYKDKLSESQRIELNDLLYKLLEDID